MKTETVLDTIEWPDGHEGEPSLSFAATAKRCHPLRYGKRLVEIGATLVWVHWRSTEWLHGYLGDVPPAEFEKTF